MTGAILLNDVDGNGTVTLSYQTGQAIPAIAIYVEGPGTATRALVRVSLRDLLGAIKALDAVSSNEAPGEWRSACRDA